MAGKSLSYQRKKLNYVRQYKAERGCSACGEVDPDCLHLHHRNPDEKSDRLKWGSRSSDRKRVPNIYNLGWTALWDELAKCDVLCANCHARETARQRREKYPERWAGVT